MQARTFPNILRETNYTTLKANIHEVHVWRLKLEESQAEADDGENADDVVRSLGDNENLDGVEEDKAAANVDPPPNDAA
ncbi:hypothetical protein Q3G72_004280 [Acer saccharum]|nr:hypothetical protein Q3G72_004280 [Acer saccharum]